MDGQKIVSTNPPGYQPLQQDSKDVNKCDNVQPEQGWAGDAGYAGWSDWMYWAGADWATGQAGDWATGETGWIENQRKSNCSWTKPQPRKKLLWINIDKFEVKKLMVQIKKV